MVALRAIVTICVWVVSAAAATECACDPALPETMKARQCSLCNEAEKHGPGDAVFFLKDINPRKPNRWLALPRRHGSGLHHLHDLTKAERTELWTRAIEKAREMWGERDWGIAYNGEKVRTQCHTHVHIGKMMVHVETDNFITIRTPAEIPAPPGEGMWIHPDGKGRLHVHLGEQTTETVLMR